MYTKSAILAFSTCCLLTLSLATKATDYPMPAAEDDTQYGWGIQRTMTLLATSTPEKRNTVRILFYGQSITNQNWVKMVSDDLRKRFPNANLIIENRAVSGFASQLLVRTSEHDLYPFYPDLLIFYVYGDHTKYDEIIANTRKRTTAEVLMQTEHMALGDQKWPETMSTKLLPEIAKKYGAELADIRVPWKKYLEDNKLEAKALLNDSVHLNDYGCFVEAELLKRHLRYDPKLPNSPWKDLVHEVSVGKEAKFEGGKLKIEFEGNRVDAIFAPDAKAGPTAKILIDGKAPADFPELYAFTRPNGDKGFVWATGVVTRVDWEKPRIAEDWTLTFTELNEKMDQFKFKVVGSKTGPDGEGNQTDKFVSTSGRVVINPKDIILTYPKKQFKAGFEIKWQCKPQFAELVSVPASPGAGIENATTLFQGLTNGKHTLEIISTDGDLPIQTLRVYKPAVK